MRGWIAPMAVGNFPAGSSSTGFSRCAQTSTSEKMPHVPSAANERFPMSNPREAIDRRRGGDEDNSATGQGQNDQVRPYQYDIPRQGSDPMASSGEEVRYCVGDLLEYATALFAAAGCDGDKPTTIAAGLVEADLLGHTTHGLQLAAAYLDELHSGGMTPRGEPELVADRGAAVTWGGRRLPGVWLATRAVDLAVERAPTHGVVTVVIRESHHIGCLAAFLQRATDRGLMIT